MQPIQIPAVFDTLKESRRLFKFEGNSLDSLAQYLQIGRKGHSGGYETTIACINGDQKAWDKLLGYGVLDVELVRKVYHKIKAYSDRVPNRNLLREDESVSICANCGHDKLISNGFRRTKTLLYRRLRCANCGHGMRERFTCLTLEKRKTIIKSD